jgi:Spy/CpxP family protein refolding chaperone
VISSATRGKLLVSVVFVLGVLVGGLIENVYETRWRADADSGRRSPQQVNQQLYDLLELSAEQRQQFQSILESSRPDFEKLFAENRKLLEPNRRKAADLQEQTRTKIRAILTEEQVKKYNEYNEYNDKRRSGPPRPPAPGRVNNQK